MTRRATRLLRDARGAVMIEFLFAFLPLLVLFLGCVQLLLLATADLVVRHAAVLGVRSAVVVLADDPRRYDNERIGSIAESGRRLAAIRSAVATPLAALGPSALSATVSFPEAKSSDRLRRNRVPMPAEITLRVTYQFPCRVPLVRLLLCTQPPGFSELRGEATLPDQYAAYADVDGDSHD